MDWKGMTQYFWINIKNVNVDKLPRIRPGCASSCITPPPHRWLLSNNSSISQLDHIFNLCQDIQRVQIKSQHCLFVEWENCMTDLPGFSFQNLQSWSWPTWPPYSHDCLIKHLPNFWWLCDNCEYVKPCLRSFGPLANVCIYDCFLAAVHPMVMKSFVPYDCSIHQKHTALIAACVPFEV